MEQSELRKANKPERLRGFEAKFASERTGCPEQRMVEQWLHEAEG